MNLVEVMMVVYPEDRALSPELAYQLFHVSMTCRHWLAARHIVPSFRCNWRWTFNSSHCKHCFRSNYSHGDLLPFYKKVPETSMKQFEALLDISPHALILKSYQDVFSVCFEMYKGWFPILRLCNIVVSNCPVTPETTNLLRLCFISFFGTILTKRKKTVVSKWVKDWSVFCGKALQSTKGWRELFYKRSPAEVYQHLKAGTWKPKLSSGREKINRDASPGRPRKVRSR